MFIGVCGCLECVLVSVRSVTVFCGCVKVSEGVEGHVMMSVAVWNGWLGVFFWYVSLLGIGRMCQCV